MLRFLCVLLLWPTLALASDATNPLGPGWFAPATATASASKICTNIDGNVTCKDRYGTITTTATTVVPRCAHHDAAGACRDDDDVELNISAYANIPAHSTGCTFGTSSVICPDSTQAAAPPRGNGVYVVITPPANSTSLETRFTGIDQACPAGWDEALSVNRTNLRVRICMQK